MAALAIGVAMALAASCGMNDASTASRLYGTSNRPVDNSVPTSGPTTGGSMHSPAWWSHSVDLPEALHLRVADTATTTGMKFLAVDPAGNAYAIKLSSGSDDLWVSTDSARTWRRRSNAPDNGGFRTIAVLDDGTLLADIMGGTNMMPTHELARSTDQGHTWTVVLPLGPMSLLTPHSLAQLHGTVFIGEYQAFTNTSVPVRLWASTDAGATWQLRHTFDDRRHCHGVRADAANNALWMFFGDNEQRTGMLRSLDGGQTFQTMLTGGAGSAVDGIFTKHGLIWGQDVVFGNAPSYISLLDDSGTPRLMATLPGPSYSIHAVMPGGYLMGTTREPAGDVYSPSEDAAHVLASPDGLSWENLLTLPRVNTTDYARADIYWTLPSGEVVLQLYNAGPVDSSYGYMLLTLDAVP